MVSDTFKYSTHTNSLMSSDSSLRWVLLLAAFCRLLEGGGMEALGMQVHLPSNWWSWSSDPGSLAPESSLLISELF